MRRIVLEILKEDFDKFTHSRSKMVESCEILHLFRCDKEEFAAIIKIQFKNSSFQIKDMLRHGHKRTVKIQLLQQEKNGATIYFLSGKVNPSGEGLQFLSLGVYLSTPFELRNNRNRVAFLGDPHQIKNLLAMVDDLGVRYKIASLSDVKVSSESPFKCLTEKQRTVIVSAFENGYFESPKKISNDELAKKLNMKRATFVEHRRKAEQRLLSQIINES